MTTLNAPPSGNAINVFLYEGFNFRVPNPSNPSFTLQPVSNTSGLDPTSVYFTKNGNVDISFSVSDLSNRLSTGTETFEVTVLDASGAPFVSSNIVTINPGRFLDQFGQTLSNRSFTFFRNEPIAPGTIRLVAPSFKLRTPTSVLSLPPGFVFSNVASNIFDIVGTPSIAFGNSNYLIVGVEDGGSKIVTTRFNIVVSNERVRVNLSGSTTVAGMKDGVAIEPRVITAIPPTTSGGATIQYTFPALPDGIVVKDIFGTESPLRTSFIPPSADPSFTMIIEGTPSLAAANAFANAGIGPDGSNISIVATRISPIPQVTSNIDLKFQFAPTVLFDPVALDDVFVGVPIDQSTNFFKAHTYFAANQKLSNIISISSPDLRSDLSLVHVFGNPRADLSGNNPTLPTGISTFTVRAEDSSGNIRDLSDVQVNVLSDFITFQPPTPVDTCYNFILSRPVSLAKDGFYPSNIQFKAVAASGLSVELSAPALTGTGISLDASGIIVGIPTQVTPLSTLSVIANAIGSPATASRDVQFAIVNDQFTFADVSTSELEFIQNIRITDVRFPVTTLSDRNVIGYSQTGLPTGLSINPAGIVSGTPTSSSPTAGNVTINVTTGFASGSRDFSYTLIPDSMLFPVEARYRYLAGQSIGTIEMNAVTFSGTSVSNYDLCMNPTYGLAFNSTTGVLSGTWFDGFPPNELLPEVCNFSIRAQAGGLTGVLPAQFVAAPSLSNVMLFIGYGSNDQGGSSDSFIFQANPTDVSSFTRMPILDGGTREFLSLPISDIQIKPDRVSELILMATPSQSTIVRATNIGRFGSNNPGELSVLPIDSDVLISSLAHNPGTSIWWGAGRSKSTSEASIITSMDDGLTWINPQPIAFGDRSDMMLLTRDSNGGIAVTNDIYKPYLINGVSLKYSSDADVLMAGGLGEHAMLRSTNEGSNWSQVTGGFEEECAAYNFDVSSIWIATGSTQYRSIVFTDETEEFDQSLPASTIKYSTDQGLNWSNASGGFNMFGYEVVYANNTWFATGVSATTSGTTYYRPELRVSTNGSNWSEVDLSTSSIFNQSNLIPIVAPLGLGSIAFDGTFWNVFTNTDAYSGVPADPVFNVSIYQHDAEGPFTSGWRRIPIYDSLTNTQVPFNVYPRLESNFRFLSFTAPNYFFNGEPPITIDLFFFNGTTGGIERPVFTSPTVTSYLQYQYMQIAPIQISATGQGRVYFFVDRADLPPGLSFNPTTAQITGAPVQIGTDSVTIYAKDDVGVSSLVIGFNTVIPRIIRKQDGAAAYTSLLRQYTEVLAAQSARDNRALPTEMRTLGEFMSPVPPPVVTPSNCPC